MYTHNTMHVQAPAHKYTYKYAPKGTTYSNVSMSSYCIIIMYIPTTAHFGAPKGHGMFEGRPGFLVASYLLSSSSMKELRSAKI